MGDKSVAQFVTMSVRTLRLGLVGGEGGLAMILRCLLKRE